MLVFNVKNGGETKSFELKLPSNFTGTNWPKGQGTPKHPYTFNDEDISWVFYPGGAPLKEELALNKGDHVTVSRGTTTSSLSDITIIGGALSFDGNLNEVHKIFPDYNWVKLFDYKPHGRQGTWPRRDVDPPDSTSYFLEWDAKVRNKDLQHPEGFQLIKRTDQNPKQEFSIEFRFTFSYKTGKKGPLRFGYVDPVVKITNNT